MLYYDGLMILILDRLIMVADDDRDQICRV
jgi:hypothetical protein